MRDEEICFEVVENVLSSEQKKILLVFIKELNAWNRRMNLTGLSSKKRILDELVADSLMSLPFLPHTGVCLDVGSGGRFSRHTPQNLQTESEILSIGTQFKKRKLFETRHPSLRVKGDSGR